VQLDRNNPKPCTEADKKAYPNGQMPEAAASAAPVDAGAPVKEPGSEGEEDLDALIRGDKPIPEAGAPAPGTESEDDILAAIKGVAAEAGAPDAGTKKVPTGQESEEDLENMIKGK
jgi:hypothetical protein